MMKHDSLQEFCDMTSFHGWRYFGMSRRYGQSLAKCFWLMIISVSIVSSIYVSSTIVHEFLVSTVSHNLISPTVALDEVFFPSVTICNLNLIRKSFVQTMIQDKNLSILNVSFEELSQILHREYVDDGSKKDLTQREKVIIQSMLSSSTFNELFTELYNISRIEGPHAYSWSNLKVAKAHKLQEYPDFQFTEELKQAYVSELASQFRDGELIPKLSLRGSAIQFENGFTTDFSEACIWLTPFIKEPVDYKNLFLMKPFSKYSLPNGLELLIDVETFDYTRSVSGSEGIVIGILHHLDVPILKNTGINLQPGQAVQIAVTPILTTASPGAKRRFSPKERKCYFSDEIKLHHLKPKDNYRYEMSNCIFEATLQQIELKCKCIPKYYLEVSENSEVCEGAQKSCMMKELLDMGETRTILDDGLQKPCLSACVDQTFSFMTTYAGYPNEMSFPKIANFCFLLRKLKGSCSGDRRLSLDFYYPELCFLIQKHAGNYNLSDCPFFDEFEPPDISHRSPELEKILYIYARQNLIKVNIYIKDPYVSLYSTEETITEIAFVGMFGGIMGLFMGSSFLSAIEIPFIFVSNFLLKRFKFNNSLRRKSSRLSNKATSQH